MTFGEGGETGSKPEPLSRNGRGLMVSVITLPNLPCGWRSRYLILLDIHPFESIWRLRCALSDCTGPKLPAHFGLPERGVTTRHLLLPRLTSAFERDIMALPKRIIKETERLMAEP